MSAPAPQEVEPVRRGRPPNKSSGITQEQIRRKLLHEARTQRKELPLDYMLRVMRSGKAKTERRDKMAAAAAPYIHAKLMTHKVGGPDGGAVPLAISGRVYVFLPDNGRRVIDVTPQKEQLAEQAASAGAVQAIEAAVTSAAEQEQEEQEAAEQEG